MEFAINKQNFFYHAFPDTRAGREGNRASAPAPTDHDHQVEVRSNGPLGPGGAQAISLPQPPAERPTTTRPILPTKWTKPCHFHIAHPA
eukprot:2698987-Amphidinium_carterae.1